jgi:hypothetical protein
MVNGEVIENGGNFWFDNFIGCNNNFLNSYIWFVILNDDWLIYLLWFDTKDKKDLKNTIRPILIKDRKRDKMIYSGTLGHNCSPKIPNPFNAFNYAIQPISMTYTSSVDIGDPNFDDYAVEFKSNEIDIDIKSIKGKAKQVYNFDYYKNNDTDKLVNNMTEWDKKYYEIISNIRYVEYVTMVDATIRYNGETQHFVSRQIIDAMYHLDKTIPETISYIKN